MGEAGVMPVIQAVKRAIYTCCFSGREGSLLRPYHGATREARGGTLTVIIKTALSPLLHTPCLHQMALGNHGHLGAGAVRSWTGDIFSQGPVDVITEFKSSSLQRGSTAGCPGIGVASRIF